MKNRNCIRLALALFALALTATHTDAQSVYTTLYAFTNFAGLPGVSGADDGTGSAARFDWPWGVAVDSAGNVYVTENFNNTIRKITPAGVVTTLAGSAGQSGFVNGTGSAARFDTPNGVAVDTNGIVYVADSFNGAIRKITPAGKVTTLASGFSLVTGVAVDTKLNVYVADYGDATVLKRTAAGALTTLAGSPGQTGSNDGIGNAARFNIPLDVAVDSAGNVYVSDFNPSCPADAGHTIRKITPGRVVTTLAGSPGQCGSADGTGSAARFNSQSGVAADSAGNVYVADPWNLTIRRITPVGEVTTVAGLVGVAGSVDGIGSAARFNRPNGVAVDSAGNIYVADAWNSRITKGTPISFRFDTSADSLTVSNGIFHARLSWPFDTNVVVEASADLAAWTPIQTNALPAGGLEVSVPLDTNQYQFFRARLAP
jgi:sugar lactone lactonase YvrE